MVYGRYTVVSVNDATLVLRIEDAFESVSRDRILEFPRPESIMEHEKTRHDHPLNAAVDPVMVRGRRTTIETPGRDPWTAAQGTEDMETEEHVMESMSDHTIDGGHYMFKVEWYGY